MSFGSRTSKIHKAPGGFLANRVPYEPVPHFLLITKTRLFKYIEKFTTQKGNFSEEILIFFIFLLKTEIVGTR